MRTWLPLLLLLLLPLTAPSVPAQSAACAVVSQACQTSTEVIVSPPTEPIPPMGPFVALPVTIRYTYVPTSFSLASTPISLEVTESPPWISATLSPSTVYAAVDFVPSGVQPVTRTLSAFLLLSAQGDAPAFTQAAVEVLAVAHGNGNLLGSSGSTQVPVQAGYFGALAVVAPSTVTLRPGDGQLVPIQLTNLGNAATRVTFEVEGATEGVTVTPPGQLTLQSRQQQGSDDVTATTLFGVEARRDFEAGPVVLNAVSRYVLDESLVGGVTKIIVHLTPRSGGGGITAQTLGGEGTGVSPLAFGLLAAGVAGTVLLERARRRRKQA